MRSLFTIFPVLASTVGTALAVPVSSNTTTTFAATGVTCNTASPAKPTKPSQDSWYQATDGWETSKPGDILCTRGIPRGGEIKLCHPFNGACGNFSAINILYRTTDSSNKPSWAVTTVLKPVKPNPKTRLVSYQHPYDSAFLDMSPSYQMFTDTAVQSALFLLLDQGYYVNMPDYEGYKASFTAGGQSGHAVLDSLRAALATTTFVPSGASYTMYGYSGGSFATEWAAELAESYAPELHFAGAALGGAYPDTRNAMKNLAALQHNNSDNSWGMHLRNAMMGIGNEHADVADAAVTFLVTHDPSYMSPRGATWEKAKAVIADPKQLTPDDLYSITPQLLDLPAVSDALWNDALMGHHGAPRMPLLIHRHQDDPLSPAEDTVSLWWMMCLFGSKALLRVNTQQMDNPHYVEGVAAMLQIHRYLDDMFEGRFLEGFGGCASLSTEGWGALYPS